MVNELQDDSTLLNTQDQTSNVVEQPKYNNQNNQNNSQNIQPDTETINVIPSSQITLEQMKKKDENNSIYIAYRTNEQRYQKIIRQLKDKEQEIKDVQNRLFLLQSEIEPDIGTITYLTTIKTNLTKEITQLQESVTNILSEMGNQLEEMRAILNPISSSLSLFLPKAIHVRYRRN